jgi:hypothetical protein
MVRAQNFGWQSDMSGGTIPNLKTMASLTMLIFWEIWIEHNAEVFHNRQAPSHIVFGRIKKEARLWVLEGTKRLGEIVIVIGTQSIYRETKQSQHDDDIKIC